jgi:hypothetical protein
MARPLLSDGSTRIRDFKYGELINTLSRIGELFDAVPSVKLDWAASNGNISPAMQDTRYSSGTAAGPIAGNGVWGTQSSDWPSEAQTGEPIFVSGITYDRISQTLSAPAVFDNTTYNSLGFKPVYRDTNQSVREMTLAQVYSDFINPVVTAMHAANTVNGLAAGSYYISTSSAPGGSVNQGIVFADTRAGTYSASNIGTWGTVQDVYDTTNYYLQKIAPSGAAFRTPLIVDGQSGLRHMTYAEFDSLFQPLIVHAVYREPGYTLRYNVNGNGVTQGTVMTNKILSGGNGAYTTVQFNADDYRAQEFPNGTLITQASWALKIERT